MKDDATPLVLLRDAPELQAIREEMHRQSEASEKRIDELKQMALRVTKAHEDTINRLWDDVRKYARDRSLLPADYSEENYVLSLADGVFSIKKKSANAHDKGCTCLGCTLSRTIFGDNP